LLNIYSIFYSALSKDAPGGGDCLNVVYNPPRSNGRRRSDESSDFSSRLSVSSAAKSTPQTTSKEERKALQEDSHIFTNPLQQHGGSRSGGGGGGAGGGGGGGGGGGRGGGRGGREKKNLRSSVVQPQGLSWGDRRAGRRPQSAKNSSREAVRILRDTTFRDRRVRHSTRLIRMSEKKKEKKDFFFV